MRRTGFHSASKLSVSQSVVSEIRYQWRSDSGCHPVQYCYGVTALPATGVARNLSRGTLEARKGRNARPKDESVERVLGEGHPHQLGSGTRRAMYSPLAGPGAEPRKNLHSGRSKSSEARLVAANALSISDFFFLGGGRLSPPVTPSRLYIVWVVISTRYFYFDRLSMNDRLSMKMDHDRYWCV